jgi:hypothetical protein
MIRMENHGSIWLARPDTRAEELDLRANTGIESQWFGHALVVEPRYVESFVEALLNNGQEVG